MNFIYEPWFICLLISILITIIFYAVNLQVKKNKKSKNKKEEDNNLTNTFIFFIISFILLMIFYYLYKYFNDDTYIASGGNTQTLDQKNILRNKIADKLTVVDDDIDVGILED